MGLCEDDPSCEKTTMRLCLQVMPRHVGDIAASWALQEETRQGETRCREEAENTTEAKDVELKAALAKVADLEKALQERDRTIAWERRGTFLKAQHLE